MLEAGAVAAELDVAAAEDVAAELELLELLDPPHAASPSVRALTVRNKAGNFDIGSPFD